MYKYDNLRLNNALKEAETYKFSRLSEEPKDPKDKIVRAILITYDLLKSIKKTPNEVVIFDNKKEIKLEAGKYITSNGKIINQETFNKVYNVASIYIKDLLILKENTTGNMVDIIERIHGNKKNNPSIKRKI